MSRSAWKALGSMSKDEAMKAYVKKLVEVEPSFKDQMDVQIRSKL